MNKIFEFYQNLIEKNSGLENLWDLIVITAISKEQKQCYENQINFKIKNKKLPKNFEFLVINDPEKIGSGGSTFHVIEQLHNLYNNNLFDMKILLIHAGGYSQRMPSCTVLGKIFCPIACKSEHINDMLDMKLAIYTPFSVHMRPGIFLASSDDLETFDFDEQIEASKQFGSNGNEFILIAHKSSLEVGKDHGVYVIDQSDLDKNTSGIKKFDCKMVLQKPSIELMRRLDVVLIEKQNDSLTKEFIYSDSLFYFSHNVTRELFKFQKLHFSDIVSNRIEVDAYRDFLQPLGYMPISLNDYLKSTNSLKKNNNQIELFEKLYSILKNSKCLVIALTGSDFYHLGTVNELMQFYLNEKAIDAIEFREKFNITRHKFIKESAENMKGFVLNSKINKKCVSHKQSLIEFCFIDDEIKLILNEYSFLSNCMIKSSELESLKKITFISELNNESDTIVLEIPENICMHTLSIKSQMNEDKNCFETKFVTIFFNKNDDLKKSFFELKDLIFLNQKIPNKLVDQIKLTDSSITIWNLKIFQAFKTMSESFVRALYFIKMYQSIESSTGFDDFKNESMKFYSLFDLLKLQNFEEMVSFRAENQLI